MTRQRSGTDVGGQMRDRMGKLAATVAATVLLSAASQLAAAADDAPRVGGTAAGSRAGCVDVEVNGQRSPSYDCLTNQLQPASVPGSGRAPGLASEEIANKPGNQIGGQFNWSATSQRMGNNFGNSATPQRPSAPPPSAPIVAPGR
ncbi:hypothetical protein PSP20601_04509 [Pandoraea sputorum]|uniref:Uncharacterized protein n=2 Tax=Pandoraea sputorum TaxID=93222 RepID=A0A239SB93_9BURK|nr:Uncharacterised protein [Pandoraea sputorum]VVE48094.1 hypothetical protein PSP20601_04509 [Pandoraea sputorum]